MLIEVGEILLLFIATFLVFTFGGILSGRAILEDLFTTGFIIAAITAALTLAGCFWCVSKF